MPKGCAVHDNQEDAVQPPTKAELEEIVLLGSLLLNWKFWDHLNLSQSGAHQTHVAALQVECAVLPTNFQFPSDPRKYRIQNYKSFIAIFDAMMHHGDAGPLLLTS